jgi:PhnB protein
MSEANPATAKRHAIAPHLVCDGAADAIEFYKKAFGAEEVMRLPGPDGRLMHAGITINGASLMLVDENKDYGLISPKSLGGSPVTINLEVANVDETVARAVGAGAKVKMEVADQFWGDRYGTIEDPFGHSWAILTPLNTEPLSEAELVEAAKGAMG